MEPDILPCDPSLVFKYWNNKLVYSGDPYYCPPALPTFYNESQLQTQNDPYNGDLLELSQASSGQRRHDSHVDSVAQCGMAAALYMMIVVKLW